MELILLVIGLKSTSLNLMIKDFNCNLKKEDRNKWQWGLLLWFKSGLGAMLLKNGIIE